MTHDNLTQPSPQESVAIIVGHPASQRFTLKERQPAPTNQLLLSRADEVFHNSYLIILLVGALTCDESKS